MYVFPRCDSTHHGHHLRRHDTNLHQSTESADGGGCLKFYRLQELFGVSVKKKKKKKKKKTHISSTVYTNLFVKCNLRAESPGMCHWPFFFFLNILHIWWQYSRPFSVFSRTAAWVVLFTQTLLKRCTFGAVSLENLYSSTDLYPMCLKSYFFKSLYFSLV